MKSAYLTNTDNWHDQINLDVNFWQTTLTCGKDPGAGYGKGIYGDFAVVTPSAYSLVRDRSVRNHETTSKDGAWVRYVEGSRLDLKDKQYFWGNAAIAKPDRVLLHEDKGRKAELALEAILADLAIINIPDDLRLAISLSTHNIEKWEAEIERRVKGRHTFEHKHPVSREIVTKTVEIDVIGIYPEGFGNIAYCLFGGGSLELDPSEIAVSLDIGSSTWIATAFDGSGAEIDRELIEGGTGELYEAIAQLLDNRNDRMSLLQTDRKHDPYGVNRALLNGCFKYGQNPQVGKDFTKEYDQCLEQWWTPRINKLASFIGNGNYLEKAKHLVAWGGGVNLPGISSRLTEVGFIAVDQPQFINAQGLKMLTEVSMEA